VPALCLLLGSNTDGLITIEPQRLTLDNVVMKKKKTKQQKQLATILWWPGTRLGTKGNPKGGIRHLQNGRAQQANDGTIRTKVIRLSQK
jgi:hypothetical protein